MSHDSPVTTAPEVDRQTALDRRLGPAMFWVALGWLALAGMGVHLLQDGAFHRAKDAATGEHVTLDQAVGRFDEHALTCELGLLLLWPLFLLEGVAHWWSGARNLRQNMWFALFPFLRLGGRDHVTGKTLWLPTFGWVEANEDLEASLERKLGVPMIGVALLVLPVLAVEFLAAAQISQHNTIGFLTHLAGAFIWLAFTVEFLVMVSVVSRRLTYIRKHWLDLAIICLPLIAFLRVLRVGRVGRLLRLSQFSKMTGTAKAFRLRGLVFRVWRAVLLFELIDRVLHRDLDQKIETLRGRLAEREKEVARLKGEIAALEARRTARLEQEALAASEAPPTAIEGDPATSPASDGRITPLTDPAARLAS
jgi:hypothetical protein